MVHFFLNGELPPLLSQRKIELRNNVIHQGSIPTREDAIGFGDSVYSVIRPVLARLRNECAKAVEIVDNERLKELLNGVTQDGSPVFKQSVHISFGPSYQFDIPEEKVDAKLKFLKSWRSHNLNVAENFDYTSNRFG